MIDRAIGILCIQSKPERGGQYIHRATRITRVVRQIPICFQIEWHISFRSLVLWRFAVSSFDEKCPFVAERVTNTQFVKYVGIMDRNVRYHEIGNQQLLEHIRSDVSLLYELSGGAAGQAGLLHRRTNELGFDAVEIDSFLGAKGTHDKRIEHFVGSLELFC